MAFQPGDPIRKLTAPWLNRVDALVRKAATGDAPTIPAIGEEWDENTIIRVRNESGATVRRWGILGIGDPIITPAQNLSEFFSLAMRGVLPKDPHRGKFCVLLEPLAAGAIGRAVIVGAVPVRLDEPAEGSTGNFADIRPNKTDKLKRGNKGVPILWTGDVEADTTDDGQFRWAVINLTPGAGGGQTAPTCCGCSPTECFDFATWDLVGDCPRLFALTIDDDIGCCNGDAGGTHILDYTAAVDGEPAMWRGPSFQCGTEGADCGTAGWTWSTAETCGSVTFTWETNCNGCDWSYTPMQISGGSIILGFWTLLNNQCGTCGGCVVPSNNPLVIGNEYGLDPMQQATMSFPCQNSAGSWVASGSCSCGNAPAPSEPGTTAGETVVVPCQYDGDPGVWSLSSDDCLCGDPVAPTEPGSIQGEARITTCVDADSPAPECGTATWQLFDCEGTTFVGELLQTESGQPQMHWQLQSADCGTADPSCGDAAIAPTVPPVTVGQIQTEPCELDGWVLIESNCECGSAIPPRAGLYHPHGTILTRPCESTILAHWRYLPASGYGPAEVQLVVDGRIKIRYRLPTHRSFCCKCQSRWDIVVGDPCEWPCRGIPQSVCMRPVQSGPTGGVCADYANAYSLTVDRLDMWPGPSPLKTPSLCEAQTGINDPGAPNNLVVGTFTVRLFVNLDAPLSGGNCWYLDEDWCYQTPTGCERPSLSTGWIKSPWSMKIPTGGSPKLLVTPRQYWDSAGEPHGPNTSDASAEYTLEDTLDDGSLLMRFPSGGGTEACYWPEYLLLIPVG